MRIEKLAAFYRQLAQLLEAGVPISRSLDSIGRSTRGDIGRRAKSVRMHIDVGATFSEAVAKVGGLFDPLQLKVIAAGEKTGKLHEFLVSLADGLEMEARFRKEMLTRSAYPLIMYHMSAFIMGLVTLLTTGSITGALATMVQILAPFYIVVTVIAVIWRFRRTVAPLRILLDTLLTYTPVLGGAVRNLALARFARAFECVYVAGIGHVEGLQMAAEATGNSIMERRLVRAIPRLRAGDNLGDALEATGAFGPTTMSMIVTGVESGKLDAMLHKVSDKAAFDAQQSIERIGRILPFLFYMVIMGLVINMIFSLLGGYFGMLRELTAD